MNWSDKDIAFIRLNYQAMSHKKIGETLNRTEASIRNKCWRLGLIEDNRWTDSEVELLRDFYEKAGKTAPINLQGLSAILGKHKTNVCRKARELGLDTCQYRKRKPEQVYSRSNAGKRKDIGDTYFRSNWEANYARYLNLLIEKEKLFKWEYEADTFWFEKIKRGTRSYTPDFKIWETKDSSPYYVEVKGWMDAKSKTKLKRMQTYYPNTRIEIFGAAEYKELSKNKALIAGWEDPPPRIRNR
jgi:hypothetical protein